jgi:hypothetical protein
VRMGFDLISAASEGASVSDSPSQRQMGGRGRPCRHGDGVDSPI